MLQIDHQTRVKEVEMPAILLLYNTIREHKGPIFCVKLLSAKLSQFNEVRRLKFLYDWAQDRLKGLFMLLIKYFIH